MSSDTARRPFTSASERSSSRAVLHPRHVAQPDGQPAAVGDDDVVELRGSVMRPVTRTSCSPSRAPRGRRATSRFCRCSAPMHLLRETPSGLHALGLQVDADLALQPTGEAAPRRRRARSPARGGWSSSASDVSCGSGSVLGRERERDDRLRGRVELLHDRRLDVLRQLAADLVDLGADVLRGQVAVALELELDDDGETPSSELRGDAVDALHRVERLLHPPRHLALDRLRRRARVDGLHHHHRDVDVGKLVDRQPAVAEEAQHDQAEHHHRREDGAADGDAAQPTARRPACLFFEPDSGPWTLISAISLLPGRRGGRCRRRGRRLHPHLRSRGHHARATRSPARRRTGRCRWPPRRARRRARPASPAGATTESPSTTSTCWSAPWPRTAAIGTTSACWSPPVTTRPRGEHAPRSARRWLRQAQRRRPPAASPVGRGIDAGDVPLNVRPGNAVERELRRLAGAHARRPGPPAPARQLQEIGVDHREQRGAGAHRLALVRPCARSPARRTAR